MNQSNVALGSVASGIDVRVLANTLAGLPGLPGLPAELAGQLVACIKQVVERVECFFAGRADAVTH